MEKWQCEILGFHNVINEDVWWDITPLNSKFVHDVSEQLTASLLSSLISMFVPCIYED